MRYVFIIAFLLSISSCCKKGPHLLTVIPIQYPLLEGDARLHIQKFRDAKLYLDYYDDFLIIESNLYLLDVDNDPYVHFIISIEKNIETPDTMYQEEVYIDTISSVSYELVERRCKRDRLENFVYFHNGVFKSKERRLLIY